MKKVILVAIFFLTFTSFLPLNAQWARTYGGSGVDHDYSFQQTSDGGYIVAGSTGSLTETDLWVLKVDSNGNIEWQKTYGGSKTDFARSIQQTNDGGYIVGGNTNSYGAGGRDVWILKLYSDGDIEWQRTYGGTQNDTALSIEQTSDGGCIVAGGTMSFIYGERDVWVLKLSSTGDIEWQKTYGGSDLDSAYSIQETNDGGYIVAGYTGPTQYEDFWVLKLSSTGNIEWQRTYGGSNSDWGRSIQQTNDGGYIVIGDKDFNGGARDIWVLKLSSTGDIEWQKTYGGSETERAYSIQQTSNGGYIIGGSNSSFGAGSSDVWVLKLSSTGDIEWQKTYGGSSPDNARSIQQTSDGGYIVGGETSSFGEGSDDVWILKLSSTGDINLSCGFTGSSDVAITQTYVSPQYTGIIPQDTAIEPSFTYVSPQNTYAIVNLLCEAPKLTISSTTGGTTDPAPGSYTYDPGTEVTIEAIPDSGYGFSGWTGDVLDGHENDNPITITMDGDKSITANFIRQYTLTIAAGAGGATSPSPGSYDYDSGSEVSVTATPNSEYQFSEWSGDASGTTNPITITMDSDKSITANFSAITEETGKKDGCFIATVAYGSPLHPHVSILRDLRDSYLMPNKLGRLLVNLYYKYSPFVAGIIAKHKVLKVSVRIYLLSLVAFSYLMVHFGSITTALMLAFIFVLPLFFVVFWRKRIIKR